MVNNIENKDDPRMVYAGIEYHGASGVTDICKNAIMDILQSNGNITLARILTYKNEHSFLLYDEYRGTIAIKSGFASGYQGGGATGFSYVLELLHSHEVEIEEVNVTKKIFYRLEDSSLREEDIGYIEKMKPIRPNRWYDYVRKMHYGKGHLGMLWDEYEPILPLGIIDQRLFEIALHFSTNPDQALLSGYRKLEDVFRKRTQLKIHGSKLFSKMFLGNDAKLGWKDIDSSETIGRANLFIGTYMAHRNPRAHREVKYDLKNQVSEFLLLNHLFRLETDAVDAELLKQDEK